MFDSNFDRQKLMYHPAALAEWLRTGRTRGPLYTEMELCRKCNFRCLFCGVDYQVNTTDDTIAVEDARRILDGLAGLGNKSVMFCGAGEPLLNPHAAEIVAAGAERMSVSVTTNGSALTDSNIALLDGLEWIRFSVNGYGPENYARIHGADPTMFERVLHNIGSAVQRKRERGLNVTIGTQLVLLEENADVVVELAARLKEVGVDYFSVKPYSQHPLSSTRVAVDYAGAEELGKTLAALESSSFKIVFRAGSIAKVGAPKPYDRCFGTHFISFISANGDVWECNVFAGDPRFLIGNALEQDLAEIWTGRRRREVLRFLERDLDLAECRDICRMDECNKYLWRLRHPWPHDNFV